MRWGQPTGEADERLVTRHSEGNCGGDEHLDRRRWITRPGFRVAASGCPRDGGVHLPATGAQALVRIYDNCTRVVVRAAAGINTVADVQG